MELAGFKLLRFLPAVVGCFLVWVPLNTYWIVLFFCLLWWQATEARLVWLERLWL